jgi:Uncharacterized conserved protein (COG2071)
MTIVRAPRGAIDTMRRRLEIGHVLVTIEHALIVTWRIPRGELARVLPARLAPVDVEGDGIVSAVMFRNRALRPARIGLPRMSSCQLSIRSYVCDPATGDAGSVFFHGLLLSSAWIARASSVLFRVPFSHLPFEIDVESNERVVWSAADRAGRLAVHARENGASTAGLPLDLLTNPHTGYFVDRAGALRKWSIWHRPQELRSMTVETPTIVDATIVDGRRPWNALYVRTVDYEVYLPPVASL